MVHARMFETAISTSQACFISYRRFSRDKQVNFASLMLFCFHDYLMGRESFVTGYVDLFIMREVDKFVIIFHQCLDFVLLTWSHQIECKLFALDESSQSHFAITRVVSTILVFSFELEM